MHKTVVIKYKPHPGQVEFHFDSARFRVLNCGRRWGKTVAGANEFIRQIWQKGEGKEKIGIVAFGVAPTYWHTQRQWSEFFNYCPPELIKKKSTGLNATLFSKENVTSGLRAQITLTRSEAKA